jgi:alcohol dehydrogenase
MGLDVVAVDINEEPLERARSLGADTTVNASEVEDVPGEVHAITDGGAEYSVDALGIAETCTNSVLSLDVGGTHIQIGLTGEDEEGVVPVPVDIITGQELEFVGSKGMQPTRYDELVRMVENGRLDPTKVITETVSLEEVPGVLESMTDFDHTGVSVVTDY